MKGKGKGKGRGKGKREAAVFNDTPEAIVEMIHRVYRRMRSRMQSSGKDKVTTADLIDDLDKLVTYIVYRDEAFRLLEESIQKNSSQYTRPVKNAIGYATIKARFRTAEITPYAIEFSPDPTSEDIQREQRIVATLRTSQMREDPAVSAPSPSGPTPESYVEDPTRWRIRHRRDGSDERESSGLDDLVYTALQTKARPSYDLQTVIKLVREYDAAGPRTLNKMAESYLPRLAKIVDGPTAFQIMLNEWLDKIAKVGENLPEIGDKIAEMADIVIKSMTSEVTTRLIQRQPYETIVAEAIDVFLDTFRESVTSLWRHMLETIPEPTITGSYINKEIMHYFDMALDRVKKTAKRLRANLRTIIADRDATPSYISRVLSGDYDPFKDTFQSKICKRCAMPFQGEESSDDDDDDTNLS